MAKIFTQALLAASLAGHLYRDENDGEGDSSGGKAATGRQITMDDGRVLSFGEKQRIRKDYGVKSDGNVFALIDFDNGKSVEVLVDPTSAIGSAALGHGLVQKLGDAAAGAESTDDAFEAILEVATRINKGEWNKAREGGTGGAKGSSELVLALEVVLGKDKDTVRSMLASLTAGEKAALRKVPDIATEIEKIRAAKAPSKAEQEKVAAAATLLAGLKEGKVPEREAEAPTA